MKLPFGHIRPAEWVCGGFLGLAGLRLGLSPYPLAWHSVQWNLFPKLDLFCIVVGVWILKFSRPHRGVAVGLLFLLVLCFYGFTESTHGEALFPLQNLLGKSASGFLTFFEKVRFLSLGLIFIFIGQRSLQYPRQLRVALAQARIIAPLFFIICFYPLAPLMIHAGGIPDCDERIAAVDQWLFLGRNPLILLEQWISPWMSEWMAFTYSSFGLFFTILFAFLFLRKGSRPVAQLVLMSTLVFALGYLGYSWVPVKGPIFSQKFTIPVELTYMKEIKEALGERARIERDCFPSLHTAIMWITLYGAWKFNRRLFWVFLPIALSIPLACVYLRYHYVSDVLAGSLLALTAIGITQKTLGSHRKVPKGPTLTHPPKKAVFS